MWLKCTDCGNLYASGLNEAGELRQIGSPCTPDTGKHHLYTSPSQVCQGTLQEYYGPASGMKVYCRNCCNQYPAQSQTCPHCANMNRVWLSCFE